MRFNHRCDLRAICTLALGLIIGSSHSARAQTTVSISNLFNTGVDSSGTPLATNGVADAHYINITTPPGTTFTTNNGAYHNYPDAGYITIDKIGGDGSYTVTFTTTFTLPTTADLGTVAVAGNYSIDNSLTDILINGHSTGISNSNIGNFVAANPVILPTGFYQAGTNTLGFMWNNVSGPGAIAVEFTRKSFINVPEPGNIALLIGLCVPASLFAASSLRRRSNKAK
jgi:hypothetical protein